MNVEDTNSKTEDVNTKKILDRFDKLENEMSKKFQKLEDEMTHKFLGLEQKIAENKLAITNLENHMAERLNDIHVTWNRWPLVVASVGTLILSLAGARVLDVV